MKQDAAQASAWLAVNLDAVARNHAFLSAKARSAECAAVVKADAYGLGLAEIALRLAGCVRTFFVAHPQEGVALRAILPQARIFILHGFLPGGAAGLHEHGLIPVLNAPFQVREWHSFSRALGEKLPAAIQLDTGMSRFGLSDDELDRLPVAEIGAVLVMSHLACADQPDHPANARQRDRFVKMTSRFPGVPRSLAASSGLFLGEAYHFDLVRPGAALYGVAPTPSGNPLEPVVTLKARILQILEIPQGERVGYGLTWKAERKTRLATLGIGYADGFFRVQGGRASVWHEEKPLPVLGRVSMDSISVDLTGLPDGSLNPGDAVTIIGAEQDVDALARSAGTIGYEILTSLGQRFHRIYEGRNT